MRTFGKNDGNLLGSWKDLGIKCNRIWKGKSTSKWSNLVLNCLIFPKTSFAYAWTSSDWCIWHIDVTALRMFTVCAINSFCGPHVFSCVCCSVQNLLRRRSPTGSVGIEPYGSDIGSTNAPSWLEALKRGPTLGTRRSVTRLARGSRLGSGSKRKAASKPRRLM